MTIRGVNGGSLWASFFWVNQVWNYFLKIIHYTNAFVII